MRKPSLLLACAALVASSCSALGISSPCDGTEVIAEFEQVGDLVRAANVQSADVTVGSVEEISLDKRDWNAVVTMCIDERFDIAADARAVVRSTSLLGEKFIALQVDEPGAPFLQDGDVIPVARTSKATELEEVFSKLATVLGTGNLEELNRLTSAQARILEGKEAELRALLRGLRRFTGVLAERKQDIAGAVDSLDSVARTVLDDSEVLESFLQSFAESSTVLSDQRRALQDLLFTLDRFSNVSLRLLQQTESGLNRQFRDLRPVLRTAARNSRNLARGLQTLATFAQWFPETMPGDYLQLDVCQAHSDDYDQGTNCPQAIGNDQSGARTSGASHPSGASPTSEPDASSSLELILRRPLESDRR